MDVSSLKSSLQTPLSFISHPMCKRAPGQLSFLQRACLLILPCAGLSAAMLVVYIACTCNDTEFARRVLGPSRFAVGSSGVDPDVSVVGTVPRDFMTKTQLSISGMQQDAAGHFICEHKQLGGQGDVGHVVANIAKVVVILVVLLTVTFTVSVASWHVMVTRCTGVPTVIIEHGDAQQRPLEVEMIRITMPEGGAVSVEAEEATHMIPPDPATANPDTADV